MDLTENYSVIVLLKAAKFSLHKLLAAGEPCWKVKKQVSILISGRHGNSGTLWVKRLPVVHKAESLGYGL